MDPEVPFRVDQTFSLGSDFKVAGDTYADHNNFVIRINNSKYFVEEEIAKAKECGKPLPSDLLKYVQLTCSRGGKLKRRRKQHYWIHTMMMTFRLQKLKKLETENQRIVGVLGLSQPHGTLA